MNPWDAFWFGFWGAWGILCALGWFGLIVIIAAAVRIWWAER